MGQLHVGLNLPKALVIARPAGGMSCQVLPSSYCGIEIERIQLDGTADSASSFRCKQGRAAAEERVQYNVSAVGAVEDRIHHHMHRFCGGMKRKQIVAFAGLGVGAVVGPD